MRKKLKNEKQKHCLQGGNPVYHRGKGPLGGTLAKFFPIHFFLFQIFGKQNVYEPNFAHFLGDFQLDILLTVLVNLQKTKNCLDSWGRPVMNQNSM